MSTPGHITINRGSNGPSTRRVMLITFFGSHVSSHVRVVCCSGDCGTVSPLHASEIGCAHSGTTVGLCSDPHFVVQVSIFFHAVVGLQVSPRFPAVGTIGKSQVRAARRIGRRRVKCPRRRPRYPRMRVRRCVYRWRMILSWWICWLAKLSCGSLRVVGKTPNQQCEDPLPDLWGGGQSEAELNKRLLAGLRELLRSVTSSLPARREEGVRDQQTQPQRHQQGKKKSTRERDNSLVWSAETRAPHVKAHIQW